MASTKSGKPAKTTKQAQKSRLATRKTPLSAMRNSAQEVWRAGLGAVAKAQDKATEAAELVKDRMVDAGVIEVTDKLVERFSKLGHVVEGRAAQVLSRAGVATKKDVDTLSRRVSKLGAEVEKLVLAKKPLSKRPVTARKTSKPSQPTVNVVVTPNAVPTTSPTTATDLPV